MVDHDDLNNEDIILLEVEKGSVSSGDIVLLLNNCSLTYASNLLREIWGKGLLKRKKERKPKGGVRYRYTLSSKGEKVVAWLHKRGY